MAQTTQQRPANTPAPGLTDAARAKGQEVRAAKMKPQERTLTDKATALRASIKAAGNDAAKVKALRAELKIVETERKPLAFVRMLTSALEDVASLAKSIENLANATNYPMPQETRLRAKALLSSPLAAALAEFDKVREVAADSEALDGLDKAAAFREEQDRIAAMLRG